MADSVTVTIDRSILPPDFNEDPMLIAARTPDWIQHNREMYDKIAAAQLKAREAWAALGTVMHEPPIYWQSSVVGTLYPLNRLALITAFTTAMNEYQALLLDYPTSYARVCEERAQAERAAYLATLRRSKRLAKKEAPDYKGDLRVDLLNRLDILESDLKEAQDYCDQLRDDYKVCIAERNRLQALYVEAWTPYAESAINFKQAELWKKVKAGEPDEAIDRHRALKKAVEERKAAIRDYAVTMKEVGDALNEQWHNVCKCSNKIIRLKERAK